MSTRSLAKDFHRLQKNISSFTNDEARVVDFADDLSRFKIELRIKDGLYKDGLFFVEVCPMNYPHEAPQAKFESQIFHPNIGDGYDEGSVCLNLLGEDWNEQDDLESVVQGLLFLVKNPNLSDALNPLFGSDYISCEEDKSMDFFARNVRLALEGGEVEGVVFERNPGLGPLITGKDLVMTDQCSEKETHELPDEAARGTDEHTRAPVEGPSTVNGLVLDRVSDHGLFTIGVSGISLKPLRDEWNPNMFYNKCGYFKKVKEVRSKFGGKVGERYHHWLHHMLTVLQQCKQHTDNRTLSGSLQNLRLVNCLQRALAWR